MTLSSGLTEAFYRFRNRLLGDLGFQRLAANIPGARTIARKQAAEVFDLCAGFVYSQILLACVQLDVFEKLRHGGRPLGELADELGLSVERARTLLDGAVALKLVDRLHGDRYGLGGHGAVILSNPGIVQMIKHHAMLYTDLGDPVGLLRKERGDGVLNSYWAYANSNAADQVGADAVVQYTGLMSASQTLIADDILAAYSFAKHATVLDIGGGDGTFLEAVATRHSHLRVKLIDLPPVAEAARARFDRAGMSDRAEAVGGSFFDAALPQGADCITLVRVIHDHDDAPVKKLMRRAFEALKPGGRLLIAEPMSEARAAGRVGDAYFGFYLMAMGSGRPRRPSELIAFLAEAGFATAWEVPTRMPLQTGLIVAQRA